jgi:hypothetical protein
MSPPTRDMTHEEKMMAEINRLRVEITKCLQQIKQIESQHAQLIGMQTFQLICVLHNYSAFACCLGGHSRVLLVIKCSLRVVAVQYSSAVRRANCFEYEMKRAAFFAEKQVSVKRTLMNGHDVW